MDDGLYAEIRMALRDDPVVVAALECGAPTDAAAERIGAAMDAALARRVQVGRLFLDDAEARRLMTAHCFRRACRAVTE